jgi:hypothetical protein
VIFLARPLHWRLAVRATTLGTRTQSRLSSLVLVGFIVGCTSTPLTDDAPQEQPETGEHEPSPSPATASDATQLQQPGRDFGLGSSQAAEHLRQYLLDPDGDGSEATLNRVKALGGIAVTELAQAYTRIEPSRRMDRWKVVHTLTRLPASNAVVEALAPIALAPVERRKREPSADVNAHDEDIPARDETLIRLRALAGLEAAALAGSAKALDTLKTAATSSDAAISSAAVLGYLTAVHRDPGAVAKLEAVLPPENHWMLSLRSAKKSDFELEAPASTRIKKPDLVAPTVPVP